MRFLKHLTATALLLAIGIGGMTAARAADRDPRAAVLGRQRIREELSAALAKGYLTRMDQYHILLHAKEVLSDDDLHGLEQTLDRLATQQSAARLAAKAARGQAAVEHGTNDSPPEMVTASKYEESQAEIVPAIGGPTPAKAKGPEESPFVEEDPATIGKPAMHLENEDPESCGCEADQCRPKRRWIDIELFSAVDAFKGPIDIGNANGNFGMRMGVNAAVPVLPCMGVGLQAGTSAVVSNLKGSPYPTPDATLRDQFFVTVGMFQRINREESTITWGFAYDWLFDNYYSGFDFGQWRVKGAWEFNPCNEIGIEASIPEHGSSAAITDFLGNTTILHFKPIAQGDLYWRHTWDNDASLTGKFGVAERPGAFVFGAESLVPLTKNLALTGNYTYIMPLEGAGAIGQTQEIWNVSVGIEFVPGGFGRCCATRFQPFLPVADNGSMAMRELGP